jgi:integration host factor subunit beta
MTKAELAHEVADNSDLNKQQAEGVVQTVLDSIVDSLQSGDKVEVRGFGSFRLRERRQRIARNPKTGQSVQVPAKRVVYFKLGKELKELINS